MLTKETMQQIFEEEKYRQEVRKSLDVPSSAKQRSRTMEFLNSTFFLALMSSILIPIVIGYSQSNAKKIKEEEAFERKISNERAEIKNRIDIISRIDIEGVEVHDYVEIINAYKGFDSTGGFSLIEEFAKRNIYSLIADYKYDLELMKGKEATDSIIARLSAIQEALQKTYYYLKEFTPYEYVTEEEGWIKRISAEDARNNPSKIDFYLTPNDSLDLQYITESLPQLKKFQ